VRRGEIYWVHLPPPAGHGPAVVVTRTAALRYRTAVTIAPVTTRLRDIASEVEVGPDQGLRQKSAANCDSLMTVAKALFESRPVGRLSGDQIRELDLALRYSLEIRY
jgi:mRNA interferase MazF